MLSLFFCMSARCQTAAPEVIFQSGFSVNTLSEFKFSPAGKYLIGGNLKGEYILWDIKTGKQVKKVQPFGGDELKLYYVPHFSMSNDDRFMLLPLFPQGEYMLFDVNENKTVNIFKPGSTDEYFTNALFSDDGSRILLIGQKPGEQHFCEVLIYTRAGKLIRKAQLGIPAPVFDNVLVKLLLKKALKVLANTAFIDEITADKNLDHLYFCMTTGGVFAVNLSDVTSYYNKADLIPVKGLAKHTHGTISLYNDKLLIEGEKRYSQPDSVTTHIRDTVFIVNRQTLTVEKQVYPRYLVQRKQLRSPAISTLPITVSQNMGVYMDYSRTGIDNIEIIGKDIFTDKELFRYKIGDPLFFNTTGNYLSGQLNGGYLVAISPNQQLMLECSRELVVHQLPTKAIKTVITAARGHMRLGTPVFLDSVTVLLPKPYSDGFVVNMRNGNVNRLKREIDYQDTTNGGRNAYYSYDNSQQIGIQNANVIAGGNSLVMANVVPNGVTNIKEISVWDIGARIKTGNFFYNDNEFTYFINGLPGYRTRFLINYKLVDFTHPLQPLIKPLYILKNRDTFYSANPIYFPERKQIIGVAGIRSKTGSPDLFFGVWNTDGKLLKSLRVKREKSKLEYSNLIYESQLSPDSSKILFGLYDGTAGIYDIHKNSITSTYEHGYYYGTTYLPNSYGHTSISCAAFVDDTHFITNGADGRLLIWTIGNTTPKLLNQQQFYILGMTVSPDKKYLVATNYDKTVHFINLATGRSDIDFVATSGDAYCMVNKDGYYLSNKKSNNDISFFFNGNAYEFSQFDVQMHRPDKVLSTFGYAQPAELDRLHRAWEARMNILQYKAVSSVEIKTYDAPTIEIKGLQDQLYNVSQSTLSFRVAASDRISTLDRLFVTVNGIPLYGANGLKIKNAQKSHEVNLPLFVPLASGKNQIIVSVRNIHGIESMQQTINVSRNVSLVKPNLYLIAIGASQFAESNRNLKYPVKDARDVIKLFAGKRENYSQVFVDTLFDQQVSLAGLQRIKKRLKASHTDDMVVLYYGGHGLVRNLKYYLSAYETKFSAPQVNSIPYENLEKLLDSIPARNRLMLIDACNSGARFQKNNDFDQRDFQLMQTLFSDLTKSTGASEICASGPEQRALEMDNLKNGVFVHFLKQGLTSREADLNKDGRVSVSELAEYLSTAVSAYTINNQEPTIRTENIVNDMIIWQ